MSTTTINKLLTLFGSIMLHCVKEGHINSNPVEGLKIQRKKRADEERKVYTPDDIKKIVANLPEPASKPERYWIPLIGMFSGMRMGEICGLHIDDVKQVDGIWCFNVDDEDDKRLKNLSSKRVVPVHPYLIQGGFISFVDKLRGKGFKRLWPDLYRRESDGHLNRQKSQKLFDAAFGLNSSGSPLTSRRKASRGGESDFVRQHRTNGIGSSEGKIGT